MRHSFFLLVSVALSLICCAAAKSATGDRVLVLLGQLEDQKLYSNFLASLADRGFSLTVQSSKSSNLSLFKYGEREADHLLLFSTSNKFGGNVDVASIVEFVNSGGNLILATNSSMSDDIRHLCYEFGIKFDDANTSVVDHFNYNTISTSNDNHDAILADSFTPIKAILPESVTTGAPVLYKGVAHTILRKSPLIMPILNGNALSYSADISRKSSSHAFALGTELGLITALQARNNARIIVSGSLDLFSDGFAEETVQRAVEIEGGSPKKYEVSGNVAFIKELSKWAFQEKSVVAVESVYHHKLNEQIQRDTYTIKDKIVYSIALKEWTGTKWTPFKAVDIQFQAIMLDPYIRVNLLPANTSSSAQTYISEIHLPDVYGAYTFKVDYKRLGYTYVLSSEIISIRPFRHNEHPRFLRASWVYYVGAFSQMLGCVVFAYIWLSHKEKDKKKVE